jgi:hypothetical protein
MQILQIRILLMSTEYHCMSEMTLTDRPTTTNTGNTLRHNLDTSQHHTDQLIFIIPNHQKEKAQEKTTHRSYKLIYLIK